MTCTHQWIKPCTPDTTMNRALTQCRKLLSEHFLMFKMVSTKWTSNQWIGWPSHLRHKPNTYIVLWGLAWVWLPPWVSWIQGCSLWIEDVSDHLSLLSHTHVLLYKLSIQHPENISTYIWQVNNISAMLFWTTIPGTTQSNWYRIIICFQWLNMPWYSKIDALWDTHWHVS